MPKAVQENALKTASVGWERRRANIDTRNVILEQAMFLFNRQGFDATSMRDIANAVGIKAASLYNHFRAKNDILYTVLVMGMEQLLASCQEAVVEAGDNPAHRVYMFVYSHVLQQCTMSDVTPMFDSQLYRGAGREGVLNAEQRAELVALQDAVVHLLRDVLLQGRDLGEMSFKNANVAAFSILGSIELVPYWFNPEGQMDEIEVADTLAKMALRSVNCLVEPEMFSV